jgi:uncharacterized protein (TIGR02246 family)
MEAREDIEQLFKSLSAAWSTGDGSAFARFFAGDAHFVAFDGTTLIGSRAVGDWHQPAFDTHLRGTRLHIEIAEIRQLSEDAAIVFTSGSPFRKNSSKGQLIGFEVQTYSLKRQADSSWLVWSFQNTRVRPLNNPRGKLVWRAFDLLWNLLV